MNRNCIRSLKNLHSNDPSLSAMGAIGKAPTGTCKTCGSDDLMRMIPGVGCEYGTDWIIEHILDAELEKVNLHAAFAGFDASSAIQKNELHAQKQLAPQNQSIHLCHSLTI